MHEWLWQYRYMVQITCTIIHYYILYTVITAAMTERVRRRRTPSSFSCSPAPRCSERDLGFVFVVFKPAAHRGTGKLPSPVTRRTWTEHERLKSLQTRRGVGTRARGEACLVSTSKSLQLSTSAVSITVRRSWQGQLICYAVCALFRQTHRMCQG